MPRRASICVVSVMRSGSYDDSYPMEALLSNKRSFCKRCNYRCYLLKDQYTSNRSAGWDKLLAMRAGDGPVMLV